MDRSRVLERQRSISPRFAAWLVSCVALAWCPGAHAQTFDLQGGDGCITERALRAAMTQFAERVAPDPTLEVRLRVAAPSVSFQIVREGRVLSEREFDTVPRRCKERVRAIALALVLAFESTERQELGTSDRTASTPPITATGDALPKRAAGATSTSVQPGPATEPRGQAGQPATDQPAPPPTPALPTPGADTVKRGVETRAGRSSAAALHAGGGVLLNVLPEPALIVALGIGLPLSSLLNVEITALASPGVTHPLADGNFEAQLWGGQTVLCLGTPLDPLRVAGCAGVAAAAVPAQGHEFSVRDQSTLTAWAAGLLAVNLELQLIGPVSARAHAGLHGSLVRPSFEARVEGARPDATPAALAGSLSLHVLWALP